MGSQGEQPGDFQQEQAHFAQTLTIVVQEQEKAERELGIVDGNDRFIQVIDDGSDDAVVQQFVVRMKLRNLHQLRLSARSPYFARLDFTPDPRTDVRLFGMKPGERASVYLGRWGVIKTPEYKVCVADWRSPVANLYYSGQLGPVSYDAPDGRVEGQLSLKRMFAVEDGQLLSMQDTGLLGQEKYLTEALSQKTTAKLREVVTTIQSEQNLVIRHDPFKPLCVQGVAGSGKTTIALHRIAWMLYRLQKTVAPQQLMILAPNPLFLDYISRVLPDLGVGEVRQSTFPQLCGRLLGKRMPKLYQRQRLQERLAMTKAQRDELDGILRKKGGLAFGEAMDRFLEQFEMTVVPKADAVFGGRVVLSAVEMEALFLRQLRHFPLAARRDEVRKVAGLRFDKLAGSLQDAIHAATEKQLDALLRALPDGEERRDRVGALLKSREERLKQIKTGQKTFLKDFDSLWHSMDLLATYGDFLRWLAAEDGAYQPVLEQTLPLLQKKQAAGEDLPALLWLGQRLYGYPRQDIRHVVIDEAQDVSPLQVRILRRIFGHDAFTLVGDLWQGIYGDEGIRDWKDLCQGIFETEPVIAHLSTSYRSTVEIMELAFSIIARHPVQGARAAKPVLRHGEKPFFTQAKDDKERVQLIGEQIKAWQAEGFFSMAVIVKSDKAAQKLHKALLGQVPEVRLVSPGDAAFEGGVMVMDASGVKGLEFDCVLIADAEDVVYPDERFYAKLCYVLCTRPLHRLGLMAVGKPAAWLKVCQ